MVSERERARLLRLLELLKSESMRRGRGKTNVVQDEIAMLRADIEYVEFALARDRRKAKNA